MLLPDFKTLPTLQNFVYHELENICWLVDHAYSIDITLLKLSCKESHKILNITSANFQNKLNLGISYMKTSFAHFPNAKFNR